MISVSASALGACLSDSAGCWSDFAGCWSDSAALCTYWTQNHISVDSKPHKCFQKYIIFY